MANRRALYSSGVDLKTKKHHHIRQRTPSRPCSFYTERVPEMLDMPKRCLLKWLMECLMWWVDGTPAKGICQKPLLASKCLAPASMARISSTSVVGVTSSELFCSVAWDQYRVSHSLFSWEQPPFPHTVVLVYWLEGQLPFCSILSSSSFTYGRRGIGIFRGTCSTWGMASSFNIWYLVPNHPESFEDLGELLDPCFCLPPHSYSIDSTWTTAERST